MVITNACGDGVKILNGNSIKGMLKCHSKYVQLFEQYFNKLNSPLDFYLNLQV